MPSQFRTVLCVDDDPDDRMLLSDAIRGIDSSLRVACAANGEDALRFLCEAKARQELPCLIILDINMPLMDGKQTLVHIQNDHELKGIPVVFFTTSSSCKDQDFSKQFGVKLFTKPSRHQDFCNAVKMLLGFCCA